MSYSVIDGLVYRAMCTSSAVLRLHIVPMSVCPSVCLSVTLVDQDHIWLEILEIIAIVNSPNTFDLRSSKAIGLLTGEHAEILGRLDVGWEKWHAGAQKQRYL